MSTSYEWDIEETDEHGDIIDHNHAPTLKDLPEVGGDLVLVRDGDDGRTWAYVSHNTLPIYFEDSYGRIGSKVPKKFHMELAQWVKTRA
jgi:hypothetical protein